LFLSFNILILVWVDKIIIMPVKSANIEEAPTTATKESCGVIRCCDAKDKSSFTA